MHAVGIDVGARTTKVTVLAANGEVLFQGVDPTHRGPVARVADTLLSRALEACGSRRADVGAVVATGIGRDQVTAADRAISEAVAAARAASHLFPGAQTVVDIGAEESRAARLDAGGQVIDLAINERCAAGTGAFAESAARLLGVDIGELGPLSMTGTAARLVRSQCVVFAESEMLSMIHDGVPARDIARAVHEAIVGRVLSLVRKIGFRRPVVLMGGVARNAGIRDAFARGLGIAELSVPEDPEYGPAVGAAVAALEGG